MHLARFLCASAGAAVVCGSAFAQAQDFPPDARALNAAELSERLNGHIWDARLADGSTWRMDFKSTSGYVFMDTSRGQRDTGKWRAEDGRVCFEFRRFPSGCSEWRDAAGQLYLKRSTTGEVVPLQKRP